MVDGRAAIRAYLDAMFQTIKRHPLASGLSIVLGLPIVLFVLWTTIALHYTYSSGERAGLLQKLSKRGWMCKTWEGELRLAALPGIVPEKFRVQRPIGFGRGSAQLARRQADRGYVRATQRSSGLVLRRH